MDVIQISTGSEHSCALIGGVSVDQGKVKCWGKNNYGQLGNGNITSVSHPTLISEGLSNVEQVSLGEDTTCALIGGVSVDAGQVKCWGKNQYSELGDLTTSTRYSPVYRLGHGLSKAVYAGPRVTCTINQSDQMLCTGYNYQSRLEAVPPNSVFVTGLNN